MNLKLAYRPLLGGVGIVVSSTRKWATLGLIAQGDVLKWAITAAHAIGTISLNDRITVFQGPWNDALAISNVEASEIRINSSLDVAAIPIMKTVAAESAIVNLGVWGAIATPAVNMEVVRVGVGSGIARGKVESMQGSRVRICRPAGYPSDYSVGEAGDSGALWLGYPGLELISLHLAKGNDGVAISTAVEVALPALGLQPI